MKNRISIIFILFLSLVFFDTNLYAQKITKKEKKEKRERERERERRKDKSEYEEEEEDDEYDGPDKAALFEFNKTKDPKTGTVPRERILVAIEKTKKLKEASLTQH